MADGLIAMANRELHMVKTVIRKRQLEVRIVHPGGAQFLVIAAVR